MQIEKTVFISYRRTNVFHARAVYQSLKAQGYDVFMDYASLDSGAFDQIILRQIDARAHFLVLLTPSALEHCDEPGDWLRREIERALDMKRNIVPLMFEGFDFGNMKPYLTGKLAALARYNGLTVPAEYFDEAMEKLCARFLNTPLEMVIHPTLPEDRAGVQKRQEEAEAAPRPTESELSAEQYNERGITRRKQGDYAGAIADYNEAIRLNPQYAIVYFNRGLARDKQGDYAGATANYTKAIRLDPKYADAYCNRGLARGNQGDTAGAIADYSEAIRLNPQYADAYCNRGTAQYNLGNAAGAIADYTEAIRLNPQDAIAYNNRGLTREEQGDTAGAIADYTEAIRLNPQDADTYYNRGGARQNQGDMDDAIRDYGAALKIDPNHQLAKTNLEKARKERGRG